jgi:hypothetical protein
MRVETLDQMNSSTRNRIVWIDEEARKGLKDNQVLVASKFRTNEGKLIDLIKDGYAIPVKNSRGKITHYKLDKSKFDDNLLRMLNFRIPTSAHNSMSVDEIAGFLPYESADLMILSRNKVTQKGIDFDIDKENGYHLWHTVENGRIISLDKRYSLSTIDDEIKIAYDYVRYLKKNASATIAQYIEEYEVDEEQITSLSDIEEQKIVAEREAKKLASDDIVAALENVKKLKNFHWKSKMRVYICTPFFRPTDLCQKA